MTKGQFPADPLQSFKVDDSSVFQLILLIYIEMWIFAF